MEAWAAAVENGAAHESVPFYADATFWVAVGFVLFCGAVGRTIYRVVTAALDDRAERIKNQIEEAERLAAEAEEAFARFEKKQAEAGEEAKEIIVAAEREAARFAERAAAELEQSLKRREQQVVDRIAQVEAAAIAEVRAKAADIAIAATRRLLTEQMTAKRANALIDQSIADLEKKLH